MRNETELTPKELQAIKQMRNSLMQRGRLPSYRELMVELGYKSPRSAAMIYYSLTDKGFLKKKVDGNFQFLDKYEQSENAQTVDIPLLGSVSCGKPLFAEENVEAMIPVSIKLAPPKNKYFILRASGDSMNKADIENGDLVLVRRQQTATNGDLVVALIDDEVTIKKLIISKGAIILQPCSTNPIHQPIILDREFEIQGIVMTSIGPI